MKKQISGIAGAARIKNVDRAALARAEKHGKRLDKTGQARAINEVPPVTTTGLDLQSLYEKHIEGAFVPQAKSSAMHLLIQFPTELVDGKDADYMLHHARAFAETVFGKHAIFADRVDRDERSERVVDLFLAPRYIKTTKHESKPAVSTTFHLKALTKVHGEKPLPFGYGRALQTALFEYMRDVMQLEGVERGKPKAVPGKDWKSAEQLRDEELATKEEELAKSIADLARQKAALDAFEVDSARRAADRERQATEREQDLIRRSAAAAERETAIERREAEMAAAGARADAAGVTAERARVEMEAALAEARRAGEEAARDRLEAERALGEVGAERVRLDAERSLRDQQFALLMRSADEDSGLNLRLTDRAFSMRRDAMRPEEHSTYNTSWSNNLIRLGRQLALLLEKARQLILREKKVEARETAVTRAEQDATRDRVAREQQYAAALADIHRRECDIEARENIAAARVTEADIKAAAASEKEAETNAKLSRHNRWALAIDAIIEQPDGVDIVENRVQIDRGAPVASDANVLSALRDAPPLWALNVLYARLDLADSLREAAAHERSAAKSAEELNELIARAGRELSPEQRKVASEVQDAVRRSSAAAQAWQSSRGNAW